MNQKIIMPNEKTSDTKVYILYAFVYMKSWEMENHSDRSVIAKGCGWEEGTNGNQEGNFSGDINTLYSIVV